MILCLFFLLMAEYEKKLEDAVTGDTTGMFQRVLVSLLTVSKLWSVCETLARDAKVDKQLYRPDQLKFLIFPMLIWTSLYLLTVLQKTKQKKSFVEHFLM